MKLNNRFFDFRLYLYCMTMQFDVKDFKLN